MFCKFSLIIFKIFIYLSSSSLIFKIITFKYTLSYLIILVEIIFILNLLNLKQIFQDYIYQLQQGYKFYDLFLFCIHFIIQVLNNRDFLSRLGVINWLKIIIYWDHKNHQHYLQFLQSQNQLINTIIKNLKNRIFWVEYLMV